ncbi:MAG: phasin family protein [Neorhizobium sp.]|nr:phasin family protein [Neorhizobium sp.]
MAHRTDDIFSFSAFDPAGLGETMRDLAEKGATQSRDAYAKMKAAAEEASRTMESTIYSAQAGSMELGIKAIDALRTNTDMSLSHIEALFTAKSLSHFVELQTTFLRRQAEVTLDQARTMQDAARKVAEDVTKPGKQAAEKVMAKFQSH